MASKNKPTGDFVVGLDIGYSNVKMAYGHADQDQPSLMVRPAQAAPVTSLNGNIDLKDGEHYVYLNNEQWVGFVNPGRSGVKRELHGDYPSTDTYRALFNASISEVCADGRSEIDHLITGLHVKQARNSELVERLTAQLTGTCPSKANWLATSKMKDRIRLVAQGRVTFAARTSFSKIIVGAPDSTVRIANLMRILSGGRRGE